MNVWNSRHNANKIEFELCAEALFSTLCRGRGDVAAALPHYDHKYKIETCWCTSYFVYFFLHNSLSLCVWKCDASLAVAVANWNSFAMRMSHLRFRTVIEINDFAYAEHMNSAIKGGRRDAGAKSNWYRGTLKHKSSEKILNFTDSEAMHVCRRHFNCLVTFGSKFPTARNDDAELRRIFITVTENSEQRNSITRLIAPSERGDGEAVFSNKYTLSDTFTA